MLIVLRGLRVLVGMVAAWQCIGLLPVFTWITRLDAVTVGMAGTVLFKLVVLAVCVAAFYWLGALKRKRGAQRERVNDVALAGIALVVVVVAIAGIAVLTPYDAATEAHQSPTADSSGWTEQSTGLDFSPDPSQAAPSAGVRYHRDAKGIIYRLYQPGMRPDLPPANPFDLRDSTTYVPPRR